MRPLSPAANAKREDKAKEILFPNYVPLGDWRFMSVSSGIIRDLSAADLDKMDYIEQHNLFTC